MDLVNQWIPILNRHIIDGIQCDSFGCPVYAAFYDALGYTGKPEGMGAGTEHMRIHDRKYAFNSILKDWVIAYDKDKTGMPEMILKLDVDAKTVSGVHAHDALYKPDDIPMGWHLQLRIDQRGRKSFVFLSRSAGHADDRRTVQTWQRTPTSCWEVHFDPFEWAAGRVCLEDYL